MKSVENNTWVRDPWEIRSEHVLVIVIWLNHSIVWMNLTESWDNMILVSSSSLSQSENTWTHTSSHFDSRHQKKMKRMKKKTKKNYIHFLHWKMKLRMRNFSCRHSSLHYFEVVIILLFPVILDVVWQVQVLYSLNEWVFHHAVILFLPLSYGPLQNRSEHLIE